MSVFQRHISACVSIACLAWGAFFSFGFRAEAQNITGTIVGTVTDSSGASVQNAQVVVHSSDRQRDERTLQTDGSGNFSAPALQIGKYDLSIEAKGFKREIRKDIVLNVNDKLTFPITLEIGSASESVTVQESPIQVQLQSAEQSTTITGAQIRELGLVTRNYEQLVGLMPGVSASNTDQLFVGVSLPSGLAATIPFSINGTRNSMSSWTIDGADNVDHGSNQTLLNTPSVDALAEFKVQRSGYSAEFGRAGGGQINVVTKSGTSEFHGDVYEFVRNDAFAANNFLNNATRVNPGSDGKARTPPLRWNNFGWTLGGPIFIPKLYNKERNKTFFFVSEEFRRVITYSTQLATVPTDAEKNGIFSRPVCIAYRGNTCTQNTTRITNIDPLARAYLNNIFAKVPAGAAGTNQLFSSFRNVYNFEQEMYKLDHIFSPKLQMSARYLQDSIPTIEPGGLFTGNPIPGVATTSTKAPGHNWTVLATSSFTPSLLNQAGFTYSYGAIISDPIGLTNSTYSPGIKATLPFPVTLSQVPNLTFSGGSPISTYGPYRDYSRNYNFFDNMTKILGKHTLHFGGTFNHYQKTENAATGNQGTFAFTSSSAQIVPGSGSTLFEQAFANFLVGNVATFSQSSKDITPDLQANLYEIYVQDDWRVRPTFTLNVGARYSVFRQPTDANGQLTTFDPSLYSAANAPTIGANGLLVPGTGNPLNGISVAGQSSPYGSKVQGENLKNVAPRFGFAWDPTGKGRTSLRGGYGIFYDATLYGDFEQNIFVNPPYVNAVTIPNTSFSNPTSGTATVNNSPKVLRAITPNYLTPYTQQWDLSVQQQLPGNTLIDVSYVGTKGTHLLGIVDINEAVPGLAYSSGLVAPGTVFTSANTPLINRIRPYRGYNAINSIQPWFNSNYNSLQVNLQKRFTGDSQVSASYTWSMNLTDNQTDRSTAPQNSYDARSAEYGRAQFDRRHVFNATFVYELPFMRRQQGLVGKTLGGWEISGLVYANSGLPLTVTTAAGTDPAGLGFLGSSAAGPRPDAICSPESNAPRTRAAWFNTSCFANVPAGTIRPGNAGRGIVNGPGFYRWDLSLFKNITFAERFRLQIRGESTNTFNHTNPNAVGTQLGSTTYGNVTSYRDPRILQLAAKFYF